MLRLIPRKTKINFLGKRKICGVISAILGLATVVLLTVQGLNYGIDFAGGTLIQTKFAKSVEVADVRSSLAAAGYEGLAIQEFDGATDEYLIRVPSKDVPSKDEVVADIPKNGANKKLEKSQKSQKSEETAVKIAQILTPIAGAVDVRRVEFVGPQIGDELRVKGLIALLLSLFAILIYISIRFEFRYAVGAIAALTHDVFLTVGIFSLLQKEVTLAVLAALLTIIGYSLNDTIVVFDRVRENRRKFRKTPIFEVLNRSVNEMLNRTLMTSLTTLAVLLALYFLGGGVIHDFAFTLMFGVIVGTYSSVFIAAPVVLGMEKYYQNRSDDDIGFGKNVEKAGK